MIDAIKKFSNGYRAVGIKETMGREGYGWLATIIKDEVVIGEAADYADGGSINENFNKSDRLALQEYTKSIYPQYERGHDEVFLAQLVEYEVAINKLKSAARKKLMASDESNLDEHGVATSYTSWKVADSPVVRAKLLAKQPGLTFLNDELAGWESIRKPSAKAAKHTTPKPVLGPSLD